ncbi:MAG: hypothetical protein AB7K68_09145 [Bacteriovoracia bacterium]
MNVMKILPVFLFGLTAAINAAAAPESELIKSTLEAQPSCGNFVRYDDQNLYLGFGSYRRGFEEPRNPIPGQMRVVPFDGSEAYNLATKDAAIDTATVDGTAYVLTYSSIEEWNLAKRERTAGYQTYAINGPLAYQQHAQAFARYKDKLIIAHGRLGVSFFNTSTKRLTNQYRLIQKQLPLESMATGVTVQGNLAYVVLDNFHLTQPGDGVKIFRGIVVINMDTEAVVAELGGMDPGADSIVSDAKKVIVSFGGVPIWKYGINSLKGRAIPEPEIRVWRFPVNGHPVGAPMMDDKYYYSCFSKAPLPGENGGYYRSVPMALDRRMLMLD